MPFYRIYHPGNLLSSEDKTIIAKGFTKVHAEATGTTVHSVKVAFIAFQDVFSGGVPDTSLIRVVGLIKGGRSAEVKAKMLAQLDEILQPYAKNGGIETTLVENLPADNVRHAGEGSSQDTKDWAALAPPQKQ